MMYIKKENLIVNTQPRWVCHVKIKSDVVNIWNEELMILDENLYARFKYIITADQYVYHKIVPLKDREDAILHDAVSGSTIGRHFTSAVRIRTYKTDTQNVQNLGSWIVKAERQQHNNTMKITCQTPNSKALDVWELNDSALIINTCGAECSEPLTLYIGQTLLEQLPDELTAEDSS